MRHQVTTLVILLILSVPAILLLKAIGVRYDLISLAVSLIVGVLVVYRSGARKK